MLVTVEFISVCCYVDWNTSSLRSYHRPQKMQLQVCLEYNYQNVGVIKVTKLQKIPNRIVICLQICSGWKHWLPSCDNASVDLISQATLKTNYSQSFHLGKSKQCFNKQKQMHSGSRCQQAQQQTFSVEMLTGNVGFEINLKMTSKRHDGVIIHNTKQSLVREREILS